MGKLPLEQQTFSRWGKLCKQCSWLYGMQAGDQTLPLSLFLSFSLRPLHCSLNGDKNVREIIIVVAIRDARCNSVNNPLLTKLPVTSKSRKHWMENIGTGSRNYTEEFLPDICHHPAAFTPQPMIRSAATCFGIYCSAYCQREEGDELGCWAGLSFQHVLKQEKKREKNWRLN
jgi:hypothetical protein